MRQVPISLMLLDDRSEPAEGVLVRIRAQPGFKFLKASAKLEEAVRQVKAVGPDIVLINLPEGNARITLAGAVHGAAPTSRVILMGLEADCADMTSLVQAQVSGFIMADATFEQYLYTIQVVAGGLPVLPPALIRPLFRQLNPQGGARRAPKALDVSRLTGREREVAALVVRGKSNREIAVALEIALFTVKSHVHRVLTKLALRHRVEIASLFELPTAPPPEVVLVAS